MDNFNVIAIDWSNIAGEGYMTAAGSVAIVGSYVAEFIDFLEEEGNMDLSTIKIIGHSLGAHVAGIAAREADGLVEEVVGESAIVR